MNLLRTYSKILIIRNYLNYIRIILSILIAYVLISFTSIYIDSILTLKSLSKDSDLRYTCISILTIMLIAGVTFIIYQFYTVMRLSIKDYIILRELGATYHNIRFLNLLHMFFLMIVSIPIGLYGGFISTSYLITVIGRMVQNRGLHNRITSSSTLFILSGFIISFIIAIGMYMNLRLKRMPLSLDNTLCNEEIYYGDM